MAISLTGVLVRDEFSDNIGYWSKICALIRYTKNDTLQNYFERLNQTPFNVSFRSQLAHVIETTSWNMLDGSHHDEILALSVIDNFVNAIDDLMESNSNHDHLMQLNFWKNQLLSCKRNPREFTIFMKENLNTESGILQFVDSIPQKLLLLENQKDELYEKYNGTLFPVIQHITSKTNGNFSFSDKTMGDCNFVDASLSQYHDELRCQYEREVSLKEEISQNLNVIADECSVFLEELKVKTEQWRRMQTRINIGKELPVFCNLDTLGIWYNSFACILTHAYKLYQEVFGLQLHFLNVRNQNITLLREKYEEMITTCISCSLVVEKPPPQVLKTKTLFECRLRLLIGDALDIHKTPFQCSATLLYGEDYQKIQLNNLSSTGTFCKTIQTWEATSNFDKENRLIKIDMQKMKLNEVERHASATEEKFAMMFQANVSTNCFGNSSANVTSKAFFFPIVIVSHGKQQFDAMGTIFWDSFLIPGGNFFEGSHVTWLEMMENICCFWRKNCGLGLNHEAKIFLTKKFFKYKQFNANAVVSWEAFNKEVIVQGMKDDVKLTFWKWIYSIMHLIKDDKLKDYWNDGIIHGFITKKECKEKLNDPNIEVGTILFRFSESMLGAISMVRKSETGKVYHHAPLTLTDYNYRSLVARIMRSEKLKYLYPDRPKQEVFQKHKPKTPYPQK